MRRFLRGIGGLAGFVFIIVLGMAVGAWETIRGPRPIVTAELWPRAPKPRRHLTSVGRMFVVLAISITAAIVVTLLVMVPSRFGVSPG